MIGNKNFNSSEKKVRMKKLLYKKQIFNILYLENKKTIADLCVPAGVSIPTMTRLMQELMEEGWVIELGAGLSRGGRRPVFYGLNPVARYILAIEIAIRYTRINLYSLDNKAIGDTLQIDTGFEESSRLLEIMRSSVDSFLAGNGIVKERIIGAGIIMPGLIDKKSSRIYIHQYFGTKPLNKLFTELLNVTSYIEHNTKAMAMGESWFGMAKNKSNVLCLDVGAGVGLGMILNGELYQGASGFSGEFGHIQMVPDGELCYCGKIGCLETVASGSAIVAKAVKKISQGSSSIIKIIVDSDITKIDLPVIIEAAHQGDQFAIELIEESGTYLAKGLAILIHLFNPEMIIIGGDMARAENLLTAPIEQKLNKYTMARIRQDAQIVVSRLKEESGLLGAIPVVMNNLFTHEPNIIIS